MRDYKFRGKRKDNGEWVYGYYFISERDIEDGFVWRDIPQIQQRYGDHYQYFDVIPETIGQYTGLKDKNGKEIYEGDIVDCRRSGDEEYTVHVCIDDIRDLPQALFGSNLLWCEAIGNIHDNPELLEDIIAKAREGEGK
jgi:uncharacterized phage protein (TIGR01671 family)